MKIIIFISLLLTLTLTFTVEKNNQMMFIGSENSKLPSILNQCSSDETQAAYNAIGVCETSNITETITCIKNYMVTKISQRWNVFSKSMASFDAMTSWVYYCSVVLKDYGKFGRQYILWPSKVYGKQQITRQISQVSLVGDCLSSRVSAVQTVIKACDISGNQNATACIVNKLKSSLNEYWDAYSGNSDSGIAAWYYNQCGLLYSSYGPFKRNYYVWKATQY